MPDEVHKVSSLLHYAATTLLCVPPVRVDYVVVGAGVPSHYGCWRDPYLHLPYVCISGGFLKLWVDDYIHFSFFYVPCMPQSLRVPRQSQYVYIEHGPY